MASMNGSGKNLTGVASVDLGLTPSGAGFGGDQLRGQLQAEIKRRKKKGLLGQLSMGDNGMALLANANPIGVGQG